jgi:hypothetical protein
LPFLLHTEDRVRLEDFTNVLQGEVSALVASLGALGRTQLRLGKSEFRVGMGAQEVIRERGAKGVLVHIVIEVFLRGVAQRANLCVYSAQMTCPRQTGSLERLIRTLL